MRRRESVRISQPSPDRWAKDQNKATEHTPRFRRGKSSARQVFAALDPRTAAASPATLDASGTRQFIEAAHRVAVGAVLAC